MQSGPSRELFELWAPDSRNGLIITGYSVEGTLARVSVKWLAIRDRPLHHFLFHVYYTKRIDTSFHSDHAELPSFYRYSSQFLKLISYLGHHD
jgi:Cft2 family RNA processing exonuclease